MKLARDANASPSERESDEKEGLSSPPLLVCLLSLALFNQSKERRPPSFLRFPSPFAGHASRSQRGAETKR